jgi:DNA-binding NarL/FixJ family response regulator
LTKREIEVTKYITGGLTNREIANMLSISKLTVENHLKNIFEKLGVRNRTQLAVKIQGDKEVLELVETRSII